MPLFKRTCQFYGWLAVEPSSEHNGRGLEASASTSASGSPSPNSIAGLSGLAFASITSSTAVSHEADGRGIGVRDASSHSQIVRTADSATAAYTMATMHMCQQLTGGSRLGFSRACSWLPREARMGSRHWFIAYAHARLLAMRCAAARMRCSLDSKAKSCTVSRKHLRSVSISQKYQIGQCALPALPCGVHAGRC